MNAPEPETKRALLPRDGFGPVLQRLSPHKYVATVACEVPSARQDERARPSPAWEFIFECELTGQRRRWGLVSRVVVYS